MNHSEDNLRTILDSTPFPIIITRKSDNSVLYINKCSESQFKISQREAMGLCATDYYVDADARKHLARLLAKEGHVSNFEVRLKTATGEFFWALLSAHVTSLQGESVTIASFSDITAHKQAERILQEAEERYRKMIDAVTAYTYSVQVHQDHSVSTHHSSACLAVTGYSQEDYSSDPYLWHSMIHPLDREMVQEVIAGIYAGRAVPPSEHRLIRRDGTIVWVRNTMVPFYDAQGDLIAYDGLVEDISERKQAEEALRESEERYRLIFDHSPLGIMHFDSEGTIRDFNDKFSEIMGAPRERILGFNMLTQLRDPAMLQAVKECLEGKLSHYEGDYVSVTGDKTTPLRALYKSIASAHGGFLGAVGLFEDITERRRMEDELLKSKKLETIRILAGGIAHDFNNILSIVLGNIGMAQLDVEPDTPCWECLAEAEQAALQARNLTNKFITFTMVGLSGKTLVPIGQLIGDSVALALSGSSTVTCKCSSESDSVWSEQVEVARDQMSQVLCNVIMNAKEAMVQGGTIELSADCVQISQAEMGSSLALKEGRYIKISIKDNGLGIPKKNIERVFDPYFSTKERGVQKGMGLGLTIVQAVVKKHKGYVCIESDEGLGTTVHIWLPIGGA